MTASIDRRDVLRGFSHEAVAVDPAAGYVYETEDAGSADPRIRARFSSTARAAAP